MTKNKYFQNFALFIIFALTLSSNILRAQENANGNQQQTLEARIVGEYLGFEGDDRIGFEIGPGANGVYPFTLYEDGLPKRGHDEKDDDRYIGKAVLKGKKLEIELTQKFDGEKKKHVERKLHKLTADIFQDGEEITLMIPKNKELDTVEVVKLGKTLKGDRKNYPDEQFALESSLPGIFEGKEGETPIVVEVDKEKNGLFQISFYEKERTEREHFWQRKREDRDVRYIGIALLHKGKLEIVLHQKYREITKEHLERSVRRLTADLSQSGDNIRLTIPATGDWKKVDVSQTMHIGPRTSPSK